MKPLYKHDCDDCIFIKSSLRFDRMVDYYICGKELKTLVYRYSSDPSDNGAIDFLMFGQDLESLGDEYKVAYQEEYKMVADYHKTHTSK